MKLDRLFADLVPEQLRMLLLAVASRFDSGFTAIEVERFCLDLAEVEPDDDLLVEPIILFQGEELPFVVDAFKNETDTLEVAFIAPAALADVVEEEIRRSLGGIDVRRIRA
jgi:hypothetical protein